MTVVEIVMEYLKEHKYDGLYDAECGCVCTLDDIAPCGNIGLFCEPAYKAYCGICRKRDKCETYGNSDADDDTPWLMLDHVCLSWRVSDNDN